MCSSVPAVTVSLLTLILYQMSRFSSNFLTIRSQISGFKTDQIFDLFRDGFALIVTAAYHNVVRISHLFFCSDFFLLRKWYSFSVHGTPPQMRLTVRRISSKFARNILRESVITSIVFQRLRRRQLARLLHRLLPPSMLMAGRSTL